MSGRYSWLLSIFALFLFCCRSAIFIPAEAETEIARKRWADANMHTLQEGYSLYTGKCGRCHELYKPAAYGEDEWNDVLPKMGRKAHLSEQELELVKRYLFTRRAFSLGK